MRQLWDNYRKVRMGVKRKIQKVKRKIRKENKELRKRTMRKIREQGGTSFKLFWTDVRGKRKQQRLNRMKDEGKIVEGEGEVRGDGKTLGRTWEE